MRWSFRSHTTLAVLSVFVSILTFFCATTLRGNETTDKVDKLFAAWDKTTAPGATLAVIKDGNIVYERGYGMAKLEDGIVNTPERVFDIGSVSKQFTAACVAMLVREGRVGLDDDIRRYLPEMPAYDKPVTVRHLLHHTSGLRDLDALLGLAGFRPETDAPTVEEAAEIVRRQKRLNFAPGDEYSYTNTGFFLLSRIVERVSGKSLNTFAQERIFRPLGMTKTLFQDDHTQIIKDRATGYSRRENGFAISMSRWDITGAGNVLTTVRDLFLWDQAFYSGALGKDLMAMLQTRGALNSGKTIDYAFGLGIREYRGLRIVTHLGGWAGFRTAFVRFPERGFSVIVLANVDAIDPAQLAFGVADIYLADFLKEPQKEEPKTILTIAVPRADLEAQAGNWQDDRFGMWLVLAVDDGKLFWTLNGERHALAAVAPGRFAALEHPTGMVFELMTAEKGTPARAKLSIGNDQELRFRKAAPVKPLSTEELREYAGKYVSEELLDVRYTMSVEKGQILLRMRTLPPTPLKAMAPDKFALPEYGFSAEFTRAKGGHVTGFRVNAIQAAGLMFVKEQQEQK